MAEDGCELLRAAGVQASPAAVEGAGAVWRTILAEAARPRRRHRRAGLARHHRRALTRARKRLPRRGESQPPAGADHPCSRGLNACGRARTGAVRSGDGCSLPAPLTPGHDARACGCTAGLPENVGARRSLSQPAVVRSRWRPAWVSGAGRRARSSVLRSAGTGIGHEVSAACGSGSGSGSGSATASGSGAGSAAASGAGCAGSGTTDAGVATGSAGTAARPASP